MQKAIIVREYGNSEVLRLEDVSIGDPGEGELLIRQTAIGVNYHDVYVRSGLYKTLSLPGIPGCEAVGVIEKIGYGVRGFQQGDRIGYLTSGYGAYATHRLLDKNLALKLPNALSDELIATNFLRAMTVQMLVEQVATLTSDHTILVTAAAGGVGRLICQWANLLGASVIGTVSTSEKAMLAKSYGCKHSIVFNQKNVIANVMDLTDGAGVDVVYDSVGADTFFSLLEVLVACGHLVNFGQSSGPVDPIFMSTLANKSLTVSRPILFHYIQKPKQYNDMAISVFNTFKNIDLILPDPEPYSLDKASEAHEILESRRGGGSLYLIPE